MAADRCVTVMLHSYLLSLSQNTALVIPWQQRSCFLEKGKKKSVTSVFKKGGRLTALVFLFYQQGSVGVSYDKRYQVMISVLCCD